MRRVAGSAPRCNDRYIRPGPIQRHRTNAPSRGPGRDAAGAEVIGALILFGVFVTTIALLNITAVPDAGLANEEEHYERTLSALNGIQSEAETAAIPGNLGATVARSLDLAPPRTVGQDFFSFFLATPARASGELTFEPDHGNLSVLHHRQGNPGTFYDIGGESVRFPLGRLRFDPHPVFRAEGVIDLEDGGVVTTAGGAESMRFDPPIAVDVASGTTYLSIKARVLNGTPMSIGGVAPVRTLLTTEAATLLAPTSNNAVDVTMRLNTTHGDAWSSFLARISAAAGLTSGTQYYVGVDEGAGSALDRVTWMVNGTATGNDIRLTTGLAVYTVAVS